MGGGGTTQTQRPSSECLHQKSPAWARQGKERRCCLCPWNWGSCQGPQNESVQLWSPAVVLEQPWMCPGCRGAQPGQAQAVVLSVGLRLEALVCTVPQMLPPKRWKQGMECARGLQECCRTLHCRTLRWDGIRAGLLGREGAAGLV